MTVEDIAQRVAANRAQFEKKFKTRKEKQDDYYLNLKRSISSSSENPERTPTSVEAQSPSQPITEAPEL